MIYTLMTSKERIQAAINHREGDKVPIDSWLAPEVAEQLIKILEIDTETDPLLCRNGSATMFSTGPSGFAKGLELFMMTRRKRRYLRHYRRRGLHNGRRRLVPARSGKLSHGLSGVTISAWMQGRCSAPNCFKSCLFPGTPIWCRKQKK